MPSKAVRRARRETAQARLTELAPFGDVSVRNVDGSHITIFLSPLKRVEYWPGSAKWAYDSISPTHMGSFDDLIAFLGEAFKKAQEEMEGVQHADSHFDVLDDLDSF